MQKIQIKKLSEKAVLPTRAHADDAGLDIYSLELVVLGAGLGTVAKTGVAVAIEPGYVGMVADRSSLAKKGVKTAGGIIDSGYRGEIGIVLWNISKEEIRLEAGERIAQLLLIPIVTPAPVEADSLDATARGEGGFGSTGK
jgi:dUTP pyrophosphatase